MNLKLDATRKSLLQFLETAHSARSSLEFLKPAVEYYFVLVGKKTTLTLLREFFKPSRPKLWEDSEIFRKNDRVWDQDRLLGTE